VARTKTPVGSSYILCDLLTGGEEERLMFYWATSAHSHHKGYLGYYGYLQRY